MQDRIFNISTSALLAACIGLGYSGAAAAQDDGVVTANAPESLPEGQGVEVGSAGEISITVVDLDITRVLQLLSMQSDRNIVTSRAVSGEISASLSNVDFYEALDAILVPNGFGYIEQGSFIYVYTSDEIETITEAQRTPIYEIIALDYMNAQDASSFIAPLLSDNGVVTVSAETTPGIDVDTSGVGENSFALQDTLMIRDYEENVGEIKRVLAQLDVRPPQVKIEATILKARVTENNAFGIDFALFSDISLGNVDGPFEALGNLIAGESGTGAIDSGNVISTDGTATNQTGGIKVGVTGGDGAILIRALDSITDTTLLARPQLLVLNRQRADLLVGERLGYITTTRTDVSDSETVEFLEVGTQLTVRPFVSSDGYVRMELSPSVSSGDTIAIGNTVVPNETTETLTTNVIVKSGQTVVLGGLFSEDTTVTRSQIPWLGDIPFLGLPGSNRTNDVQRNEVIFMVRPVIMRDEVLYAEGDRANSAANLALVGQREQLLPWSRTAMVQDHLKKAHESRDAGDTDRALWHVENALYLDPTQSEALELRSQMSDNPYFYMTDSILDGIVNESMGTDTLGSATPATPQATESSSFTTETTSSPQADVWVAPATDAEQNQSSNVYGDPAIEFSDEVDPWEAAYASAAPAVPTADTAVDVESAEASTYDSWTYVIEDVPATAPVQVIESEPAPAAPVIEVVQEEAPLNTTVTVSGSDVVVSDVYSDGETPSFDETTENTDSTSGDLEFDADDAFDFSE